MSIFDDVTKRVSNAISRVSVPGAAGGLLKTAVGKYAPKYYGAASSLLNGDLAGAAMAAARANLPQIGNPFFNHLLWNTLENPLLGGITPLEAQRIFAQMQATQYAKKNLFFLEILDYIPDAGGAQQGGRNIFNMFATSASFSPISLTADQKQIGSGIMDGVSGRERLELRLTTYDDAFGSVKQWFENRANAVARPDGTFGLPTDYLVQVRILHAAINEDVMKKYGGFERKYIMRPTSIESELSRVEDNLEELQLSFSQFDTFMFNESARAAIEPFGINGLL